MSPAPMVHGCTVCAATSVYFPLISLEQILKIVAALCADLLMTASNVLLCCLMISEGINGGKKTPVK